MTGWWSRVFAGVVAAVLTGIGLLVLRPEPAASWITLTAPPGAIAGEPYTGTLTLHDPPAGHFLTFDFHGLDTHRDSLGCVAVGQPIRIDPARNAYTFSVTVPGRTDLVQVRAIVHVSTTGRWSDRTAAVSSAPIPLLTGSGALRLPPDETIALHDEIPDPAIIVANPAGLRFAISGVWLSCAVLAWRGRPRGRGPRAAAVLALICLGAALWEATAPGNLIADFARGLARDHHLYNDRRWLQQAATLVVAGVGGALATWGVLRSRDRIPSATLTGLCVYASVALASMLSLHEIDEVLAREAASVPVASFLRLAAVVVVLIGLLRPAAPDRV